MKLRLATFLAALVLVLVAGIPHFTRSASAQSGGGVGLGLAEAQAEAKNARVFASTLPPEGAVRPRRIVRSQPSSQRK